MSPGFRQPESSRQRLLELVSDQLEQGDLAEAWPQLRKLLRKARISKDTDRGLLKLFARCVFEHLGDEREPLAWIELDTEAPGDCELRQLQQWALSLEQPPDEPPTAAKEFARWAVQRWSESVATWSNEGKSTASTERFLAESHRCVKRLGEKALGCVLSLRGLDSPAWDLFHATLVELPGLYWRDFAHHFGGALQRNVRADDLDRWTELVRVLELDPAGHTVRVICEATQDKEIAHLADRLRPGRTLCGREGVGDPRGIAVWAHERVPRCPECRECEPRTFDESRQLEQPSEPTGISELDQVLGEAMRKAALNGYEQMRTTLSDARSPREGDDPYHLARETRRQLAGLAVEALHAASYRLAIYCSEHLAKKPDEEIWRLLRAPADELEKTTEALGKPPAPTRPEIGDVLYWALRDRDASPAENLPRCTSKLLADLRKRFWLYGGQRLALSAEGAA